MQIAMFPQWQELEAWLATNENEEFDLWKWPTGAPSEDLYSEFCSTYFDYVDIWESIRKGCTNEDEQMKIDKVALFGCEWDEVPWTTLKSGKISTKMVRTERKSRIELSLQAEAYTYSNDFWSSLGFALKPQSVREVCELAKNLEIGDYREQFYAVKDRGFLFENCEEEDPAAYFESFKNYHASWQACFAEAASENCGLLVFCWSGW